ncbi:hypothetical protein B566_EDAN015284 [Ephemera danica]|nr:hypothetical protein B566_EDAN015284 [Ephemera danica]
MGRLIYILVCICATTPLVSSKCMPLTPKQFQRAEQAARQWAPLVWLAPGERYFPSSALDFLSHTRIKQSESALTDNLIQQGPPLHTTLPTGSQSKKIFLETIEDLDSLLANASSFLHGHSPMFYSVPVYAVISSCCPARLLVDNQLHPLGDSPVLQDSPKNITVPSDDFDFEITYWLFFPYSEGKRVCTVNAGALGPLPIPWLRTACLGSVRSYGSHVGDWEHVTLAFRRSGEPSAMYVSTHEAGALYSLPPDSQHRGGRTWTYSGHELRRGGRLQNPRFPRRGFALQSGRPVLFAAKGSHGLWTLPGRHKYVTFPNLEDETGFGIAWNTWQNLQVLAWPASGMDQPRWLGFQGHWGNPRSGCHPLSQQVCQISDGPQGIPMKKHAFRCLNTAASKQITRIQLSSANNLRTNKIN